MHNHGTGFFMENSQYQLFERHFWSSLEGYFVVEGQWEHVLPLFQKWRGLHSDLLCALQKQNYDAKYSAVTREQVFLRKRRGLVSALLQLLSSYDDTIRKQVAEILKQDEQCFRKDILAIQESIRTNLKSQTHTRKSLQSYFQTERMGR